jgi:type VI secretion system secreted protein VgrG
MRLPFELPTDIGEALDAVGGAAQRYSFSCGALGDDHLRVVSLEGREAMSELFSFELIALVPLRRRSPTAGGVFDAVGTLLDVPSVARELEGAILGQAATLTLRATGDVPRVVRGIVTRLERLGSALEPSRGWQALRIEIRPRLYLATLRKNSRVFQNMTGRAIIDELLDGYGVPRRWEDDSGLPARAYSVQYDETDYDFIARLLAEAGYFFFFDPPASTFAASLADAAAAVAGAVLGGGDVQAAALGAHETVVFGSEASSYAPIAHRGMVDALSGGLDHVGEALLSGMGFSGGLSALANARDTVPELMTLLRAALTSPRLPYRPDRGALVGADDHVIELDREHALAAGSATLSDYDFTNPRLEMRGTYRPLPRVGPSEAIQNVRMGLGVLAPPAIVAGETGEVYEHSAAQRLPGSDSLGAKVVLEQVRRHAERARGRAFCHAMSPGHRFIVDDHPLDELNDEYVVTGVHHRGHDPSWEMRPGDAARRSYENTIECVPAEVSYRPARPSRRLVQVLETATVVGPADHEVHSDRHGRIKVQFAWDRHGQRNELSSCWLRVMQPWGQQFLPRVGTEVAVSFLRGDPDCPVVLGALFNGIHAPFFPAAATSSRNGIRTTSTPGGDGFNELSFEDAAGAEEIRLRAQRDLCLEVQRDRETTIEGNDAEIIQGDRVVEVRGRSITRQRGGARTETNGTQETETQGTIRCNVSGDREASIGGHERVRVVRTAEYAVDQDVIARTRGSHTIVVGTTDAKRSFVLNTQGIVEIDGSDGLELRSSEEVVLRCGRSSVRICDDGVFLNGPTIGIAGEDLALTAPNSLTLITEACLALNGELVKLISSQGGAVGVGTEVKVDGSRILLNSPNSSESEPEEDPPTPTGIELLDHQSRPVAGARYVLVLADRSRRSGVLDQAGRASVFLDSAADVLFPDVRVEGDDGEASGAQRTVVVRQGDHLERLAAVHGFAADEVWNGEDNRELRERRGDPRILNPGDLLVVPRRVPAPQRLELETMNSFVAAARMLETRVRFFDENGPLAGVSCVIEGLGEPQETSTDGDGYLSIEAPAQTDAVRVFFPGTQARYRLELGGLNPISEPSGVQMRLSLLGYYDGAVSDGHSDAVSDAIRAFQAAHGLDDSGVLDDETRSALEAEFGA